MGESSPGDRPLPPQASEVAAEIKRKLEKKQRKKLKQEKKRLEALAAAAEAAETQNSSLLESPKQVGLLPPLLGRLSSNLRFVAGWLRIGGCTEVCSFSTGERGKGQEEEKEAPRGGARAGRQRPGR